MEGQFPAVAGFQIAPWVEGDMPPREMALKSSSELTAARDMLGDLQHAIAVSGLPEPETRLQHTFIDGVYIRTLFIPAGSVIVGKIHKHAHGNILSQGNVIVFTEQGGQEFLSGPLVMVSPPGCKRAVYCETDTVWTTIHRTDETDLAKIEDWVIARSYEEYEQYVKESQSWHG